MKGYFDYKLLEMLSLGVGEAYDVAYAYNGEGQVVSETVTGAVTRSSIFSYDLDGNVTTETITLPDRTITKTYGYDALGNVESVTVIRS